MEVNQVSRAKALELQERRLASDFSTDADRAAALRTIARISIMVIEDHGGGSTYFNDGNGVPLTTDDGFHVWSNNGALYRIPHGKYAALDILEDSNRSGWSERTLADIESLRSRTRELLEPYRGE